jgi:hypothetical protein
MINVHRRPNSIPRGNRVDPTVVRAPRKVTTPCLACASRSRVAQHNCR